MFDTKTKGIEALQIASDTLKSLELCAVDELLEELTELNTVIEEKIAKEKEREKLIEQLATCLLIRGLWPDAFKSGRITVRKHRDGRSAGTIYEPPNYVRIIRGDGEWRDFLIADLPQPMKAIWSPS